MSNIFGNTIKISIFGESHGPAIGLTFDGFPAGIVIDPQFIQSEMDKRKPGGSHLVTPRSEADQVEILSGVFNGISTGAPITGMIRNNNTRSGDYDNVARAFRPAHADYTAFVKHKGFNDYRGGGHFSGRLTAPLVFAGALAKLYLKEQGIVIKSHLLNMGELADDSFLDGHFGVAGQMIPVINESMESAFMAVIEKAKAEHDSIGGTVETVVLGMAAGYGEPFFDSVESSLSKMMFSIPGIKGVSFGLGFGYSGQFGSKVNDGFCCNGIEEKSITATTNNNGGILGGITSGMPIVFQTVFKPTPSIGLKQKTCNTAYEEVEMEVVGRHDPCIALRGLFAVESATAIVVMDLIKGGV